MMSKATTREGSKRQPKPYGGDDRKNHNSASVNEASSTSCSIKSPQPWSIIRTSSKHREFTSRTGAPSREAAMKANAMPQPYTYTPLPDGPYVRILRLHPGKSGTPLTCSLRTHLLDDVAGSYDALSYVWGTDEPTNSVLIDGCEVKIRWNLWTFLQHLRTGHKPRDLWADAICIDQSSTHEKNHQVQQMKTVYTNSGTTRLWLGLGDRYIAASLKRSSRLHQRSASIGWQTILTHEYWTRLWVVQEVVLSPAIMVHTGKHFMPWEQFIHRYDIFSKFENRSVQHLSMVMTLNRQWIESRSKDFHLLLKDYGKCSCADVRDRVFGLLGLSNEFGLAVDYMLTKVQLFVKVLQAHPAEPTEALAIPLWNALDLCSSDVASEIAINASASVYLKLYSLSESLGPTIKRMATDSRWNERLIMLVHPHSNETLDEGDLLFGLSYLRLSPVSHMPELAAICRKVDRSSTSEHGVVKKSKDVFYRIVGTVTFLHPEDKEKSALPHHTILQGLNAIRGGWDSIIINIPLRDLDLIQRTCAWSGRS